MGAGTVVEPYGIVLTAHYLVVGADEIRVSPLEGEPRQGHVVGIDFVTGLAAIHLEDQRLPGLEIRKVGSEVVGEEAFLIASTGEERRVANGLVTSYAPFETFWEYVVDHGLTCSAASAGLGGGPLIDARGQMLGVVSLSLAEVGKFTFAVPAHDASSMLTQIARDGSYTTPSPRAWLGITCYPVGSNLILAGALPESPAEQAGLLPGDIVVEADGAPISDRRGMYEAIWKQPPGETLRLKIRRGEEHLDVEVRASSIEVFFDA